MLLLVRTLVPSLYALFQLYDDDEFYRSTMLLSFLRKYRLIHMVLKSISAHFLCFRPQTYTASVKKLSECERKWHSLMPIIAVLMQKQPGPDLQTTNQTLFGRSHVSFCIWRVCVFLDQLHIKAGFSTHSK